MTVCQRHVNHLARPDKLLEQRHWHHLAFMTIILREKMWNTIKTICAVNGLLVEVSFFLYKTGESMLDTSMRPYIVETVCMDLFTANQSICSNLGVHSVEEDVVQSIAANYLMYYRILVNIPAIILGLFCGAWSDRSGRKVPMVLPSLGSVLAVLLYMVSFASTSKTMAFILAGAAVQGIFGKSSVITMAVNSYVADVSEQEDRTRKLGRLQAMNFFGLFIGSLLSGSLSDTTGLETVMCLVVFVHGSSIMITLMCISESLRRSDDANVRDINENTDGKSKCKFFSCSFLNAFRPANVKESILVLTAYRPSQTRHIIVILVLVSIINQTCKSGEIDISVLFVERSPLNWPKSWFGYMMALDYAVMGLCLFFVLPLLSNIFLLADVPIVMIAVAFRVVRLLWAAFAYQTWMVYASVFIGAFGGLVSSATRSLLSKTVNENELGKSFAILASGETASKLLGTVIFANIYGSTAHFFSGFAYIVEAMVYVILFVSMIWFNRQVKLTDSYKQFNASSASNQYTEIEGEICSMTSESMPPPEEVCPDKKTVRFLRGDSNSDFQY